MIHPEQHRQLKHMCKLAWAAIILLTLSWIAFGIVFRGELAGGIPGAAAQSPTVSAFITRDESDYVWIYIDIPAGQMLYSMDQVPGAPVTPLEISPMKSPGYKVGTFEVAGPPARSKLVDDTLIYYHIGQAVFNAPVRFNRGVPTTIQGTIRYGVCGDDYCLPPQNIFFTAKVRK